MEPERKERLERILERISETREALGEVMWSIEDEPQISAALVRVDTHLAGIQADVGLELNNPMA
jgi:hypothetical protein